MPIPLHKFKAAKHQRIFLSCLVAHFLWLSLVLPAEISAQRLSATPSPQPPLAPSGLLSSTIQRIRERNNTLIAGVKYDFDPFGYIDSSGDIVGFDVDLVRALAELWGVKVEFVPVTSANRIQFLATGVVDLVAASMTHTKEREAEVDFSQTYFLDGQSLLVGRKSLITDTAGLDGKTVAAIQGSTSLDNLRALATKNNIKLSILPFQEYPPALAALKAGQVDALTSDRTFLLRAAQKNPDLHLIGEPFSSEPYGLGVPLGDSYFRNLVNFTLQTLKANGKYDQIYAKWFPATEAYPIEILPGQWPYTFATSPTTLKKPSQTSLVTIRARGKLLVGVKYDFPPFGFLDQQGKVQGFDVDIAREFARRWLGSPTAVELVPVTSDTRIPFLAAGAVDLVIASMTHTQPRDDLIDFSETYFGDGQSLLVRKNSGIQGLDELNGKTVAAVVGSTSIDNIRAVAKARGLQLTVLPFQEYPSALQALKAGQVDVLTTDQMALTQLAADNPTLEVVGAPFTQEPYGIGVPNFDSQFRNLVNATLQTMKLDGVYDALYQKWFGAATPYALELWPGVFPATSTALATQNAVTASAQSSSTLAVVVQPTVEPTVQSTRAQLTPVQLATVEATRRATPQLILVPTAIPTTFASPSPSPASTSTPTILPTSTPEVTAATTPLLHRVAAGDTLGILAVRYYGKYQLWTRIYAANRDKIGEDPNNLTVGMDLLIPPEAEP